MAPTHFNEFSKIAGTEKLPAVYRNSDSLRNSLNKVTVKQELVNIYELDATARKAVWTGPVVTFYHKGKPIVKDIPKRALMAVSGFANREYTANPFSSILLIHDFLNELAALHIAAWLRNACLESPPREMNPAGGFVETVEVIRLARDLFMHKYVTHLECIVVKAVYIMALSDTELDAIVKHFNVNHLIFKNLVSNTWDCFYDPEPANSEKKKKLKAYLKKPSKLKVELLAYAQFRYARTLYYYKEMERVQHYTKTKDKRLNENMKELKLELEKEEATQKKLGLREQVIQYIEDPDVKMVTAIKELRARPFTASQTFEQRFKHPWLTSNFDAYFDSLHQVDVGLPELP